jgi:hypothetical protein
LRLVCFSNAIKYLHQCEGVRRDDVSVLSLQLMSWAWFTPVQAKNYPNVTLPGHVYHPHVSGGYSIAKFLDANYDRAPIFLCGLFTCSLSHFFSVDIKLLFIECFKRLRTLERRRRFVASRGLLDGGLRSL